MFQKLGGFSVSSINLANRCGKLSGTNLTECNAATYHITATVPIMNYASTQCGPPNFLTGGPCNANQILPAFNAVYGPAYIDIYSDQPINATLSVTPPAGGDSTNIEFSYTLNFTATASSPTIIMIPFAAHIAVGDSPGDLAAPGINWGFGWGASAISGAPYHVDQPATDGVAGSGQDNQLDLNGGYSQPLAVTQLSSGTGATLSTGSYVSDTLTLTPQGNSPTPITGTVGFYYCYEPNITSVASAAPCLPVGSPASSPTVTVYSQVGVTQTLTAANNNVISSANFLLISAGVWCFRALYVSNIYPWQSTDAFQTTYAGQTNGGTECVFVQGSTAVTLSNFTAQGASAIPIPKDTLIPGLLLGLAALIVAAGLLKASLHSS